MSGKRFEGLTARFHRAHMLGEMDDSAAEHRARGCVLACATCGWHSDMPCRGPLVSTEEERAVLDRAVEEEAARWRTDP